MGKILNLQYATYWVMTPVCMDEEEVGSEQDFMVVKYLKSQGTLIHTCFRIRLILIFGSISILKLIFEAVLSQQVSISLEKQILPMCTVVYNSVISEKEKCFR